MTFIVASYTASGQYRWAVRFGGTGEDRAYGIAVGANGEVYVTGGFSSTVSFGTNTLTSAGGYDIFFAKLSASNGQVHGRIGLALPTTTTAMP